MPPFLPFSNRVLHTDSSAPSCCKWSLVDLVLPVVPVFRGACCLLLEPFQESEPCRGALVSMVRAFCRTQHCCRTARAADVPIPQSAILPLLTPEGKHCYPYPRPSLTVDAVIVAEGEAPPAASLLLIKRKHDPYAGSWALPGGFVDEQEPLDQVRR